MVRATPAGRKAQKVWQRLFGSIEKRWQERFGKDEIDQLRESLWAVINQFDLELLDCLPIMRYGLTSTGPDLERRAPIRREGGTSSLRPPASTSLSCFAGIRHRVRARVGLVTCDQR